MNARAVCGSAFLLVAVPVALGFAACSGNSGGPSTTATPGGSAQDCPLESCEPGLVLDTAHCACVRGPISAGTSGSVSTSGTPQLGGSAGRAGTAGAAGPAAAKAPGAAAGSSPPAPGTSAPTPAPSATATCRPSTPCINGSHWDPASCSCLLIYGADGAAPGDGGCLQAVYCIPGTQLDPDTCVCVPVPDASSRDGAGALPPFLDASGPPFGFLEAGSSLPFLDASPPPFLGGSPPSSVDANAPPQSTPSPRDASSGP
jgi:hypothetical protein